MTDFNVDARIEVKGRDEIGRILLADPEVLYAVRELVDDFGPYGTTLAEVRRMLTLAFPTLQVRSMARELVSAARELPPVNRIYTVKTDHYGEGEVLATSMAAAVRQYVRAVETGDWPKETLITVNGTHKFHADVRIVVERM